MNCSYQFCKELPLYFCSCNNALSFLCSDHSNVHQNKIEHDKVLKRYYTNDHDRLVFPFLLEQVNNLSLNIVRGSEEAIKKITIQTTKILQDIQNIKCTMISSYGSPMRNQDILQKTRKILEESSNEHLQFVNSFNEQMSIYLKFPPRESNTIIVETKKPPLIKIAPRAYDIPKIRPLPIPQEQAYPAQVNLNEEPNLRFGSKITENHVYGILNPVKVKPSPLPQAFPAQGGFNERVDLKFGSRVMESKVWYVAGMDKVCKKLPKFISDQINKSYDDEIVIYRENGKAESLANIREKTYKYITDEGLISKRVDVLHFELSNY